MQSLFRSAWASEDQGSGKPLWGVDGESPFPSARMAISDASTWDTPEDGDGATSVDGTWTVNMDGTIDLTCTSLIPGGACSLKAWHRFPLSNIVPSDGRDGGTPTLTETVCRYGLAVSVELIDVPDDPMFGHGVVVGIGDADSPPAAGGTFFGVGVGHELGAGAMRILSSGHTGGGDTGGLTTPGAGTQVQGVWIPVVGTMGTMIAWARNPDSTDPGDTMPTSGTASFLTALSTLIPSNPALYVIQGCAGGDGGNSPATSTLKVRIKVAPFALYQPGIAETSTP